MLFWRLDFSSPVIYYKAMPEVKDDETLDVISQNLRRLRGDLSYSEIGRRAETNASAISKIEKGEHMPGVGLLTRIADALGCTVNDLLKNPKKSLKSA